MAGLIKKFLLHKNIIKSNISDHYAPLKCISTQRHTIFCLLCSKRVYRCHQTLQHVFYYAFCFVDSIEAAFYLCSYEFTIKGLNTPWCQLFDEADALVWKTLCHSYLSLKYMSVYFLINFNYFLLKSIDFVGFLYFIFIPGDALVL